MEEAGDLKSLVMEMVCRKKAFLDAKRVSTTGEQTSLARPKLESTTKRTLIYLLILKGLPPKPSEFCTRSPSVSHFQKIPHAYTLTKPSIQHQGSQFPSGHLIPPLRDQHAERASIVRSCFLQAPGRYTAAKPETASSPRTTQVRSSVGET